MSGFGDLIRAKLSGTAPTTSLNPETASPESLFSRIRTHRRELNDTEMAWLDGQEKYRKHGRTKWSDKETTMLRNIYAQRVLPAEEREPSEHNTPGIHAR